MKISAFDLDHTLIKVNSSFVFGKFLCRKGYLPRISLVYIVGYAVLHSIGLLSLESVHYGAFNRLFKGMKESEVKNWAEEFLDLSLNSMLYDPAIQKLTSAEQDGHLTLLLSSGPSFLVSSIAKRLKISGWHSTEYAVDKDRNFCHISKLMLGPDKARIMLDKMREFSVAKEDTFAYSDSHLDLDFLQASGNPVAVNPNKQLNVVCKQNQWVKI